MSKIILILLILLSSISPSYADFEDIFPEDQYVYQYPEDKNKKIEVNTVRSPLEYTDNEIDQIKKSIEHFKSALPAGAEELFTEVGFNKFSLGTGLINVTYQVRNGVKYALKDTLAGFPEYERRKATEEILNSNIRSHRITNKFLTGSSVNNTNPDDNFVSILGSNIFDWIFRADDRIEKSPNILVTAHKISNKKLIKKLHGLFSTVAYILLVLLTSLAILKRLTETSFGYSCIEPLTNALYSILGIFSSWYLLNWTIKLVIAIQIMANAIIEDFFIKEARYQTLAKSWQDFANQIGYMPAQVLSYIDTLAQCFVYFFVAGLILHIILGVIISPIWSLAFVSNSFRSSAYNSFINWSKTVLVTGLIPVIYTIVKFISQEFNAYGYDFLEIVISIASYVYLPAMANIILAKSSGIIQPAFNGYQTIADSINNSYNGIKSSLETTRNV